MYSVSRRIRRCFSSIILSNVRNVPSETCPPTAMSSTRVAAPSMKSVGVSTWLRKADSARRSARDSSASYSVRSSASRSSTATRTLLRGKPANSALR